MKKELEEKELEVVGGAGDSLKGGHYLFTGHVGKYDGVVGNLYYVTKDEDPAFWFSGYLLKTWEKDKGCYTVRTHKFRIQGGSLKSTWYCGEEHEISGDDWTMWTESTYVG